MNVEARLRAFAAVARAGSFSRAAKTLYVSQPAVSKHIASLETELATQLVVRGRGGISLTPAGEVLAEYVLRAEALLANARRALAAGGDAQIGTLSIAASGIPGTYLLPELLSQFHEQHPEVEIDLQLSTSGGALDLVRSHEVVLALVGGMTVPPELESEPLIEDDVVLVGPVSLGGRRLRVKDLESLTWISREEGSATRAAVEAARWQIGLRTVRTLEFPSWEAVKLAVTSGAGIAAISRLALRVELQAGTLAVLDVRRWRLRRTIAVLTARGVPLTPPVERFLQLLRAAFQPEEQLPSNSNLPHSRPLLGREHELELLAAELDGSQIITLAGAGGCGKTSLAIAAAARAIDRYRDGVFFVDLAPVREADRVLEAVADVVGVPQGSTLSERLRDTSLLLVLDNFEQVIGAAAQVERIVEEARGVRVLVTSRAPLRIERERVVEVQPLARDDAVLLFLREGQKARSTLKPDDAIALICARLDGLPLAIELAATRSNVFAPAELLDQLDRSFDVLTSPRRDIDARHQTLRATLEWSYELLSDQARSLFASLSVFADGWTLDAMERVCLAAPESLAELVEHNLVQRGETRFTMLATIQSYAGELLGGSGEADETRRRQAEYFAALAEEAEPHLTGPEQAEWLARLREDAENVRAAVAWADETQQRELQLRIAGASWRFWLGLSGRDQWMTWLQHALVEVEEPSLRLRALAPLSWLTFDQGDYAGAEILAQERLTLGLAQEDDRHVAGGYSLLSEIAARRGDVARAVELGQQAVDVDRRAGIESGVAVHLHNLGGVLLRSGDLAGAKALLEESRTIGEGIGDDLHVASTVFALAMIDLREGDGEGALARALEALPTVMSRGDSQGVWSALDLAGAALIAVDRLADGASTIAAAEELRKSVGHERPADLDEVCEEAIERARHALGDEGLGAAIEAGTQLSPDQAAELVLANRASGS
jgi:DNA-binding transcriptional LysR family regulator/predicted ATPase